MKHIKPGRGPSMMTGISCIFTIIFGIIWTLLAISSGAPLLFALFGVVFIIYAIVQAIYHLNNASRKDRFSSFDITDDHEEPDPFSQAYSQEPNHNSDAQEVLYCPWCGAKLQPGYRYCTHCGRELP